MATSLLAANGAKLNDNKASISGTPRSRKNDRKIRSIGSKTIAAACSNKVAFAKKRNSMFKIESAVAKLGAGSGPCVRLKNEDLEA